MKTLPIFSFFLLLLLSQSLADCDCSSEPSHKNRYKALVLKIAAIFFILVGGFAGVCIPILGRWVPDLRPDNDVFFVVKAFAAGVILATGFIHILPDSFESLASPCLSEKPWGEFPFAGFVAMVAATGTLTVDSLATGFYNRAHFKKVGGHGGGHGGDEEGGGGDHGHGHGDHVHVHTHATHGHAHGSAEEQMKGDKELIRHRVVSQVNLQTRQLVVVVFINRNMVNLSIWYVADAEHVHSSP